MTFVDKMKNWAARSMIRTKRIKEVRYNAAELNELIALNLPHHEAFNVPGGKADLMVMEADIDIGNDNHEGLTINLKCSIDISSLKLQLYRAHLNVVIKANPFYAKEQKSIRFQNAQLHELNFVHDRYLLIKSSNDIIKALTPNILKGIVNVTLGSALSVLGDVATPQVKEYMGIFADANKQRVLEFHKPQIARLVTELVESPDMAYELEESDFEEKLFADLGRQIDVEQQHLVFKF